MKGTSQAPHCDVVVVGAGPTGLLLAGDLARAGLRVTVLEKLSEPSAMPKANAVIGQAARLLQHRGIHRRLGFARMPDPSPLFQFGGLALTLSLSPYDRLHGIRVTQQQLEQALAERAAEAGVTTRRGCEVLNLIDDQQMVSVRFRDRTAEEQTVAARYVVGCDGAHSDVRRIMGIGFPGVTDDDVVSRSADAVVAAASVSAGQSLVEVPGVGSLGLYGWNRTERGAWSMMPRGDGTVLISAMEWPAGDDTTDAAPVTFAEVAQALDRVVGAHVPVQPPTLPGPHQLRRWRGRNTRIASAYRRGRVLLAGDAAHVHNAVGAPGLNVGLQDAACLAWRLAAAVQGHSDALGGYETDRRPAAERVVMHSQVQTLLLSPDSAVTSLRELLGELFEEPAVVSRLIRMLEGSEVTYPAEPADHSLVGTFVPELTKIDELLDDARPTLIDLRGGQEITPEGVTTVCMPVAEPPAALILVRSDGYVAWACDSVKPDELADLERTARRLSGARQAQLES
ncbi:2-polyprenyl-6-methoxyphenol hydroxylase-like FAD-dependent oxidoreductase [Paramicrobacterium agarici]|uniref:2-polyprenyl-6-methoxyphenol hydroxylase-like FAD-dependent oxidoreductase n=1 Tax=Paramicrobacterium agarici TaxID=630514 RepID=A0A2A9DR68_9MICO|nr:2-polyprenyl-6-methoxyphenol hydroxylase-like FAD-dependent oxidoreductase [Microbacterium agarici]